MLIASAEQGIDLMCATPHFYADSQRIESFLRHRREAYEKVKPIADELGIDIALGAEVAFFSGMAGADDLEKLCFEGTNTMLLEMPFRKWTEKDLTEVDRLLRRGIRPVMAHLERFFDYQDRKYLFSRKTIVDDVFDLPVYVQLNAECLLDRHGSKWLKMFGDGRAQLLGSDCHSTGHRRQNLGEGRALIEAAYGQSALDEMDALARKLVRKKNI